MLIAANNSVNTWNYRKSGGGSQLAFAIPHFDILYLRNRNLNSRQTHRFNFDYLFVTKQTTALKQRVFTKLLNRSNNGDCRCQEKALALAPLVVALDADFEASKMEKETYFKT